VPTVDQGERLGLHGRLSHTPAELLGYGSEWVGDEYELWVEGRVRHFKMFSANLSLRRRITTWLGSNHLRIDDTIRNEGFETVPLQVLYHCNFGFPVVSPETELWLDVVKSEPRDEEAAKGFEDRTRFQAPTPGYAEQVFYHYPTGTDDGYARAALVNRAMDFGAYIRFRVAELPHLIEWKMMGQGTYVVGLEPANCWVEGRARDRERGVLQFLGPGESISPRVEIGALPDAAAVDAYAGG
jgi:hypothetical protein